MKGSLIGRILVVDDEEEYRIMLWQFLAKKGFVCEVAVDAFEALAKLESQKFDLMVSDIRMKGKDGLELAREAKQRYPYLDLIMMTGHAADYSYSDILDAGAADFISKPFSIQELQAKIERIERERRTLQTLRESNEALSWQVAVNSSIADLSEALITSLPMEDISSLVLKHAKQLTNSPAGFVGYMDRLSGYLVGSTLAQNGPEEDHPRHENSVPADFSELVGAMSDHPDALFCNSPHQDPRFSQLLLENGTVTRFISVPAVAGDTLLGQLILANKARDYTHKDLTIINRLATTFALAIQRKWADEELEQTKDHIESVFENSSEAIGIVDSKGKPIKWNKASTMLFGYTQEEMKEKRVFDLYEDKTELDKMLEQLRRDGFLRRYEINMRKKDGHVAPFEISITLLRDMDHRVTGSVAVAMDLGDLKKALAELKTTNRLIQQEILERKKVEEELRKARDELELLVEERTAKLSRAGEFLKRSIDRIKDITEQ